MSATAAPLAAAPRGSVGLALRRLGVYVRRNRGYYALCVAAILAYNVAFIGVPILVGRVIAAAEAGMPRAEIAERSLWLLGLVIFGAVVRACSRILVFNAAREVEYEIRNDLFAHLQRLPQSFYFRWRTGDLMSRCVNDLNSVRLLLGPALLTVIQTPVLLLGVFAAMFAMNPTLALLVAIPYPLFIAVARAFGRNMHASSLAVQAGLAEMSNQLQESIAGISVVKAYAMEEQQMRSFEGANQELWRRHLRLVRVNGAMPAITGLLPAAGMVIVLYYGGRTIAAGGMTLAAFFTFAMYIYQLTFPTFIMGWVVALVQRGAAAMQRIDEILSVEPSIADGADLAPLRSLRGEIEFRDLEFRYDESREPALQGIRLHVPAGSSLGVVGPVGSGKTTLASLIPRLFEVEEGRVFLDGVDVNRIPLATLRSSIAMVPQEPFLFSMSLADNVAYGLPETDLVVVEEAARRAQLHRDAAELPGGYATLVGERGVMLSGGQRQRAALARALALDPRILILDDTLSAVDAETEAAIQEELGRVFAGRTVVVVASRVSSVQDCDQIVVLDGGRIVERGRHAELLARGGLYARLAREQEREERRRAELEEMGGAG
jgi:ATP-binding cassette subfamily B multidrug efflux pump